MYNIQVKPGYAFDDLLLIPKYTKVTSRSQVDLSVQLGKGIGLKFPIFPANMASVTGPRMAKKIAALGGLAILHRFGDVEKDFKTCSSAQIGASVGVQPSDKILVDKLIWAGCRIICVDVANGENINCIDMTEYIANKYPDVFLISGNVATGNGAVRLHNAGADAIRVNIGAGSTCSTRVKTAAGQPQMTALFEVFKASQHYPDDSSRWMERKFKIICDGAVKNSGDCVKALCYSDLVMSGSLFAGADETPGEVENVNGKLKKSYVGSSTHRSDYVEGVQAMVDYKGPVENLISELNMGIRSGLSYQGAFNLEELREDPQWVGITNAGLVESHPHILSGK